MNSTIPLALVPLHGPGTGRREGKFTIYSRWIAEPEFKVENFPSHLPFGLYEMEIETQNAIDILQDTYALIERGDKVTPLRLTIEPHPDRLLITFVLPGDASGMTVVLYGNGSPFLRLGSVQLRRISTTRWRLKRTIRGTKRRLARPAVIGDDARSAWDGLMNGGVPEVWRRLLDVVNPNYWSPSQDVGKRMGEFARRISAQNGEALADIGHSQEAVRPPASLSLVVPVYRTPKEWLLALIDSFNFQTDGEFEVVLVFDGPQDELVAAARGMIDGPYASKIVVLSANKGVAAATNAGILEASGDYVVVIDHDDRIEDHFVEAFRKASARAIADIYFADEAITDENMNVVLSVATRGRFDIRHYLSHPYIVHPIFIRRTLAHEAGLLTEGMRVSQDVEFLLRCLAKARSVVQIPLVLYFWRTHASSLGHAAKGDVARNTTAAVRAFVETTTGWKPADVRPGFNFNEYDVRPPLPSSAKAAIVIPTKNGKALLSACVQSIHEREDENRIKADIYVIDHQSDDPATLAYLDEQARENRIKVLNHVGPWNYAQINNAALKRILPGGSYTHIIFMNNDIELVTADWLDRMIAQFSWGDVGVVGCCLQYPDGKVQHGGVVVGLTGAADHSHRFEDMHQKASGERSPGHLSSLTSTRDYSAVTAALMVVPVPLFEAVGGFDEHLAVGFNDTDLCLRIGELGLRSTYVGGVVATHYESATREKAASIDHPDDTRLFEARYRSLIDNSDPFWGMQLDWTGTRIRLATETTKGFRLRPMTLPPARGTGLDL